MRVQLVLGTLRVILLLLAPSCGRKLPLHGAMQRLRKSAPDPSPRSLEAAARVTRMPRQQPWPTLKLPLRQLSARPVGFAASCSKQQGTERMRPARLHSCGSS